MTTRYIGLVAIAIATSPLMLAAGCGGQDGSPEQSGVAADELGGFRFHSFRPPHARGTTTGGAQTAGGGTTGGAQTVGVDIDGGAAAGTGSGAGSTAGGSVGASTGSEAAVDCNLCTKANDCCNAVGGGPLCTFSASTCSSMAAASQESYVNACQTMLTTTVQAFVSNLRAAPGECL